ncbi:MAG: DUF1016 family protein [Candidatus Competibacteraceae bacterium]|nr:DUF1016 family protein [Candidatus Competibacteraceae bacterium]
MNMYLSCFAQRRTPGDNPLIGIILTRNKDELLVRYATYQMNSPLFVQKYQLYLPDRRRASPRTGTHPCNSPTTAPATKPHENHSRQLPDPPAQGRRSPASRPAGLPERQIHRRRRFHARRTLDLFGTGPRF